MTFLAQAAAAVQQLTPSGSSAAETMGLIGLAYALVRVIDGLIGRVLPSKIGKRTCTWADTDVAKVIDVLNAKDADGRPRVYVPASLGRSDEKQIELANATAGALARAVAVLDKIDARTAETNATAQALSRRPCPLARDVRP